jgi:DNA-binding SARP family transcriptional activator
MAEIRPALRVEILGPVQVHQGPLPIDLGPTKQRAVFAALALHGGAAVTMGLLLDAVWGAKQPRSARQLLHTYMNRRCHLAPDAM